MVTKKPSKKVPVKKTVEAKAKTVEVKAKNFAKSVEKEAKVFTAESKEIGGKIGTRWEVSTTEEKIFTIIGIILLCFGIFYMRQFLGGMILIVLGILFVTGFFIKRKK